MTFCSHCGDQHPSGEVQCPVTLEPMSEPGPIGAQVDRYVVESILGAGGFGGVYRARHVHAGHRVALKLLRRELGRDPSMLDRLMREARAAAAIGNPHIVKVLDCGVSDEGRGFLALELLEGRDLKELYRQERPLAVRRAVELTLQALDGLAAAHAANVVHRDVKPANLFVLREGGRELVKLLDFGVSKARAQNEISDLTMPGTAMGTPTYMAPEQHSNARDVDARADLYSVAVVLYELLADRPPFEARSFADLIVKVRTTEPTPISALVPGLAPSLAAAIEKGLAREPHQRWQSAGEFAQALRLALTETDPMLMSSTFQNSSQQPTAPWKATPALSVPPPVDSRPPTVPPVAKTPVVPIIAGVLIAAVVGAGITLMAVRRGGADQAAPVVQVITPAPPVQVAAPVAVPVPVPTAPKIPPAPLATDLEPPAPTTPPPEREPPPKPTPPRKPVSSKRHAGGVVLFEPKTMNQLDLNVVDALLKKAQPSMEECRTDERDEKVAIQVFINPDGTLPIVQPSAIVQAQNREVATCIANRIKRAWTKGLAFDGHGIVSFEALVPRR